VELPNGLTVHAPSEMEARLLYHEIFETETYGKHGLVVRDGDCVFDVGANVGLFSVQLARRHRGLKLFAFEPLPPIFALLQKNAALHFADAQACVLPIGLGQRAGQVSFRYDPQLTLNSSGAVAAMEDSIARDAGVLRWAQALIADAGRSGQLAPGLATWLGKLLGIRVLDWMVLSALALWIVPLELVRRLRFQTITCDVRTLSEVLREHAVASVDLLKIDVEGAEWDVLQGIEEGDWPLLRQLVIEVHDSDGRVARIAALLREKGFVVTVDREDWAVHELLGIQTIYATRNATQRPT
jgi:hypothetical protein